jgi:steroid delta-isomerase-like uncharacterized protein
MSTSASARRFFDEVFSEGRLELVDELFATEYVGHPSGNEEPNRGPEGVKEYVAGLRGAASDLKITIEDQIAEGDKVATRWTARGTHDGELMGIAPTGRPVSVTGITIQHLRDGKVVESWTNWDGMGLLQQLGAVPGPPQR